MRLLVTGGAGFIGSNFIRYWLRHHPDDEIVNFDALTYAGNLENLADLVENPHYRFLKGDITDPAAVEKAMEDVETVVHFAAESHVDRSLTEPAAFVRTNVLGTQVLLAAAQAQKVGRFHHVSTDEVFGSLPLGSPEKFNETTPYQPNSPYSASKAGSDLLVRAYYHSYGLPITVTNTSNNYGPYQFPEKLVPLMIMNALADKPLPVYGDGRQVRDWIHVEEHCRGIELVLERGKAGETYCLGGEAERENIEVVRLILKLVGKPETLIKYVADRPGHDVRYAIDNAKIAGQLGYRPGRSFEQGLEETVRWYVDHQEWCRRIMNKDYLTYYQRQYGGR